MLASVKCPECAAMVPTFDDQGFRTILTHGRTAWKILDTGRAGYGHSLCPGSLVLA